MLSLIRRSLRNLIRSPLRTGSIAAILAVSIALALIMLTVNGASENQLGSVGEEIGTDITVTPAGSGGFGGMMGSDETLAQEDVDKIAEIDHVASVQGTVQTQYDGDSLESATGDDTTETDGQGGRPGGGGMGIMITGIDTGIDIGDVTLMGNAMGGDTEMEITEGRYFTDDDAGADVMIISQDLADENDLEIGDTVDIEDVDVEVIGIYDSGTKFGNNFIVMPLGTVQSLFDIDGVSSVTVVADYVDNVDGVADAIREIFDEDTADVTTDADQYERINDSVSNAGSTSRIGMIAAFIVAGVVILFSVILMVRQRVKEIGILKAIGASNWHIGLQFTVESLAISLVAAIIGALATFPLAQKVADLLVSDSTSSTGPGGGGGFGGGFFGGGQTTSIGGLDVAVSPEVFLYALGIAIGLAVLASLVPSWYISRVKPAEVLRNE